MIVLARLREIAADVSVYLRFGGELTRYDIFEMVCDEECDEECGEQSVDQVLDLAEARLRRFALSGREWQNVEYRLEELRR